MQHLEIFLVILFSFSPVKSQSDLVAVKANAILPTGRYATSAIFDGQNSIYIFGGRGNLSNEYSDILKYDILGDTIQLVASLPRTLYSGTVSIDKDGNVYYISGFGAAGFSRAIYKFTPSSQNVEVVGYIPSANYASSAITVADTVYIFGGELDVFGLVTFNMSTNVTQRVASLPNAYHPIATIYHDASRAAYIFGDDRLSDADLDSVARFDLTNLRVTEYGPRSLLKIVDQPAAVTDGKFGYIIGGFYGNTSAGFASDGIIRFDPDTMIASLAAVNNFPVYADNLYAGTSAVWVEATNRIYFFGGASKDGAGTIGEIFDSIWYVDLTPRVTDPTTEATTTTTVAETSTVNTTTTTITPESTTTVTPESTSTPGTIPTTQGSASALRHSYFVFFLSLLLVQ